MTVVTTGSTTDIPFARLNIVADLPNPGHTLVDVVVGDEIVARLPVTSIGLDYQHQGKAIVTVGLFRADIDFKGIRE